MSSSGQANSASNGFDVNSLINDAMANPMPRMGEFTAYQEHILEEITANYKLTPATLAFKLENRKCGPNDPLKWYPSPFLTQISLRIAKGIAKGNYRGIISAPPRHGKSRLSTIHGPLWVLENFAGANVVTCTYGADLSEDFARTIRDYIEDCPDLLDVRLRNDANKIAKFLTSKDGALTSIGIGGPITGRGAHVLFIDDFIKQIKEANSQVTRDYIWDWFTTTAMTRLEPNASVIIIATRWHHDDLIGRIIKQLGTLQDGTGEWDYIKYHAIAREDDPLGRQVGEALFPQRYPVPVLESRRKLLGSFYFDAIFDQEPHETTSDLTKKEWIIKKSLADIPKNPMKLVRVWDFAGTESDRADYTAGGLLAGDIPNKNVYLLNMTRAKLTAGKVEDLVEEVAEDDGPMVEVVICQETGSAGKAVVNHYQTTVLPSRKVYGYYWNTQKQVIAQPWLAACEAGHFFILDDGIDPKDLEHVSWNRDFINEFGTFPSDSSNVHDDQIDVCANGYIHLFGKKKLSSTWAKNSKTIMDKIVQTSPEQAAAEMARLQQRSPHQAFSQYDKRAMFSLGGNGNVSRATFGRKSTRYN